MLWLYGRVLVKGRIILDKMGDAADEKTKDITKQLIDLEEKLAVDIRRFL